MTGLLSNNARNNIQYTHWLLSLLVCLLLTSCQEKTTHAIEFYHWKTSFSPTLTDRTYFKELKCQRLYLRFFDVDKTDGQVAPKAIIKPFDASALTATYIPVVFITNRTLQGLPEEGIEEIADNVYTLIREIEEKNDLPPAGEIQIDCDWTESTRENYFRLLTCLQELSKREITCTLRLHQIKFYRKTGVPPVTKGYLMCYATSDPSDSDRENSILDMDLLKDYTAQIEHYPLEFDIALPLYSWAVITNHLGRIKLINGVTDEDIDPEEFEQLSDHVYQAKEDLFFRGMYLNKGFTVRVERISPQLLQQAKIYLNRKIKKDYTLVYYHLGEPFLQQFTIEELQ